MNNLKNQELADFIKGFKMPRYEMLSHINLYLEQVIDEVVFILEPLFGNNDDKWITPTMVANYVKQGIIPRPTGKKYTKEHIAYLVYICVAKQILSISEIKKLIEVQMDSYPINAAYDYFCTEFENILFEVFGAGTAVPDSSVTKRIEADIFRSTIIAVSYTIYTRKFLEIY